KPSTIGVFVVALIVMGLGAFYHSEYISPLVAEQYKRTKNFVIIAKSGERVIVNPALTVSADGVIVQYFYLFLSIGALSGQISMAYSEKVHL
ncbi:hypothetical protein BD779DRAFT_1450777, partial [Infundibulicybe gibba]